MRFYRVLAVMVMFATALHAAEPEWFPFNPAADSFQASPIDLRWLNEKFAGEMGRIIVKDGKFAHATTGEPLRFWAVNGPPQNLSDADLKRAARMLAKYGVNMVRIHSAVFNEKGEIDPKKIEHCGRVVAAMKEQGIYSLFSIYFPLWIKPGKDCTFLKGYDGTKHPFAALFFNEDFQKQYRAWWQALLTAKLPDGVPLLKDKAVAALEIQNEDSFFFWTFSESNLPEEQRALLEGQFGDWLKQKYSSLDAAFSAWKLRPESKDQLSESRVSFRPLWNIANQKTVRDQDTARFLFEKQFGFYQQTIKFLRDLGFEGMITASNWATASPEVLGPLEKWSYSVGDFIDRHGYFGCNHKGPNSEWSIRDGHTYSDRSAYRFDPEEPGKPKLFVHPAMDIHYDNKPSMISETTWTRPNRYRSEAPIYLAAFGALQQTDAIVHFAHDGIDWSVKPQFWMQPWTLTAPSMLAQFPAAALIYRMGLVASGESMVNVTLNTNDLLQLKGTPLPQDAAFDELRLKDLPKTYGLVREGQRIDPLVHYSGRTDVAFGGESGNVSVVALDKFIDHEKQHVLSSTGELLLDYDKGVLFLDGKFIQGVSGNIGALKQATSRHLIVRSDMDLLHVLLVPLDRMPVASSRRLLLQVMTEEKNSGFTTTEGGDRRRTVVSTGTNPWEVRAISGSVEFVGLGMLSIKMLDLNGYADGRSKKGENVELDPKTLYYLIEKD